MLKFLLEHGAKYSNNQILTKYSKSISDNYQTKIKKRQETTKN